MFFLYFQTIHFYKKELLSLLSFLKRIPKVLNNQHLRKVFPQVSSRKIEKRSSIRNWSVCQVGPQKSM